ncbi:MAG: malonyl-CoA O-methyltransferase [Paraglaciecola sp.]|jgi:malonyl-CoA O-methyltransferase
MAANVATTDEQQLKRRIARQFSRAAAHYDQVAQVQSDIAFDALAMLEQGYQRLLDIGCGTGRTSGQLQSRCTDLLAMDLAQGMLVHARSQATLRGQSPIHWVGGDAERLPFATGSINGVYSSMVLQWCENVSMVCSEIYRVLPSDGHGVLAIMCQGSMHELQGSWQGIDSQRHVNRLHSGEHWQQGALAAGFKVKYLQKSYTTWHDNVRQLLGSIKQIGANVLTSTGNHAPINRQTFIELEAQYQGTYGVNGRLPLTYEVCFIQLRK